MLKDKLIVDKIVNNNIVSAINSQGHEFIVIGKGLGFKKKKFDVVMLAEITKTYRLVNGLNNEHILSLFEAVPYEIIELTQYIIEKAQEELKVTFNINLTVALADHINFSVNQYMEGNELSPFASEEVKRFYKDEYKVGRKAVRIINKFLNINLGYDHATAIAFHIIAATENRNNFEAMKIMKGVNEVLEIIESCIKIVLDESSLEYSRIVIHLKFFIKKILFGENSNKQNSYKSILSQFDYGYEEAQFCIEEISNYVFNNYKYEITEEDTLYLILHVARLLNQLN